MLSPNTSNPLRHLRKRIIFDFIDLEKHRTVILANMKASAAILPITGKEGFAAFEKQVQVLEEIMFPWKFFASQARAKAEKDGGYYLTNEQKTAVDRFLEFEKEVDKNA